mgnify:CR=1 FL=1
MLSELANIIEINQVVFAYIFLPFVLLLTALMVVVRLVILHFCRQDRKYFQQIKQGARQFINNEHMGEQQIEFSVVVADIARTAYVQYQLKSNLTGKVNDILAYKKHLAGLKDGIVETSKLEVGGDSAVLNIAMMASRVLATPTTLWRNLNWPSFHLLARVSNILPTFLVIIGALGTLLSITLIVPEIAIWVPSGADKVSSFELITSYLGGTFNFLILSVIFALPMAVFNHLLAVEGELARTNYILKEGIEELANHVSLFNRNLKKMESEQIEQRMLSEMHSIRGQIGILIARPVATGGGPSRGTYTSSGAPGLKLVGNAKPKERMNYRELRSKSKQKKVSF